jgi:hypothetical protein
LTEVAIEPIDASSENDEFLYDTSSTISGTNFFFSLSPHFSQFLVSEDESTLEPTERGEPNEISLS